MIHRIASSLLEFSEIQLAADDLCTALARDGSRVELRIGAPEACRLEQALSRELVAAGVPGIVPATLRTCGRYGVLVRPRGDARTLADVLGDEAHGSAARVAWVMALVDLLAPMHAAGWCHGYLTPTDLWIEADGALVLADLGWRPRLTPWEPTAASPCWSPESLAAVDIDHRADIFSVGALLYRAQTGRWPQAAPGAPPAWKLAWSRARPAVAATTVERRALAACDPDRRARPTSISALRAVESVDAGPAPAPDTGSDGPWEAFHDGRSVVVDVRASGDPHRAAWAVARAARMTSTPGRIPVIDLSPPEIGPALPCLEALGAPRDSVESLFERLESLAADGPLVLVVARWSEIPVPMRDHIAALIERTADLAVAWILTHAEALADSRCTPEDVSPRALPPALCPSARRLHARAGGLGAQWSLRAVCAPRVVDAKAEAARDALLAWDIWRAGTGTRPFSLSPTRTRGGSVEPNTEPSLDRALALAGLASVYAPPPIVMSEWLVRAGRPAQAADVLLRAGDARIGWMPYTALALAERALEVDRERAPDVAELASRAGDISWARTLLERHHERRPSPRSASLLARSLRAAGRSKAALDLLATAALKDDGGVDVALRALSLLDLRRSDEAAGDLDALWRSRRRWLRDLAQAALFAAAAEQARGKPLRTERWARDAIALFEQIDDVRGALHADDVLGRSLLYISGEVAEATAHLRALVDRRRAVGDEGLGRTLCSLGDARMRALDFDGAFGHYDDVLDGVRWHAHEGFSRHGRPLGPDHPDAPTIARALYGCGEARLRAGRLRAALADLSACRALNRALGFTAFERLAQTAIAEARRLGAEGGADTAPTEVKPEVDNAAVRHRIALFAGFAHLDAGRWSAARSAFARSRDAADQLGGRLLPREPAVWHAALGGELDVLAGLADEAEQAGDFLIVSLARAAGHRDRASAEGALMTLRAEQLPNAARRIAQLLKEVGR